MKRIIVVLIVLFNLVLFAGCNQAQDPVEELIQSAAQAVETPSESSPATPAPTPAPTPAIETVSSEQLTLAFNFGERTGTYSGEILDGLPHGTGSFTSKNDDGVSWTYDGAWEDGHMSGEGATVWDDGYKETGTYAGDYLNGQGSEYQDDILVYEGTYKDSVYNGQGKLLNCAGKTIYEGNFSNGFIDETAEVSDARLAPFMQQCQQIFYEEYANNNQSYIGQDVMLTGRLFDVWVYEGEEYYGDFLLYEQDNPDNIVSVVYNYSLNEVPYQTDTMVSIWGTINGMFTYTTEDGRELTVPEINAWDIALYEP